MKTSGQAMAAGYKRNTAVIGAEIFDVKVNLGEEIQTVCVREANDVRYACCGFRQLDVVTDERNQDREMLPRSAKSTNTSSASRIADMSKN